MIDTLHEMVPASKQIITNIETLTADNVLRSFELQNVPFDMGHLGLGDWEMESSELTDAEILALLNIREAGHSGKMLICTEACTRYGMAPFECVADQLPDFINNYKREMFFDGDVVMVCPESRTITVFHHAGGYVHVKL